jgi:hypothetical protein
VNGDGYSDIIVGAYSFDDVVVNGGRAYVYLGGVGGLATTPAWKAYGTQAHENLGGSVAGAGDVNGDGYSDVLISADSRANGQTHEGVVLLFLGSSNGLGPDGTFDNADWRIEGGVANARIGFCAPAGDVNGDGFSDFAVGVPYLNDNTGAAFVYHGQADIQDRQDATLADADWRVDGNQPMGYFGNHAVSAGDVNADGYSDLLVTAFNQADTQTREGMAFLYRGGDGGLESSWSWSRAESHQASAGFGEGAASAGDVNGDGFSDVVISAPGYDDEHFTEGRVWVYLGSVNGLTEPCWMVEGNQTNVAFGRAVATAGDFDGDGFSDIMVGSPQYPSGGRMHFYRGNGGIGLDRVPRQRQVSVNRPVDALGITDGYSAIRLWALARTPAGRDRVGLEWETKPHPSAFDGSDLGRTQQWAHTGAPLFNGSSVDVMVTANLPGQQERWHWRLRITSVSPFFPHTPWLSPPFNAATEQDFRTPPAVTIVHQGNPHTPLGNAQIAVTHPDTLRVSNIGSSGADGVSIGLPDSTLAFEVRYQLPDDGQIPNGSWLEWSARSGGQTPGSMRMTKSGPGQWQITGALTAHAQKTLAVYRAGQLVYVDTRAKNVIDAITPRGLSANDNDPGLLSPFFLRSRWAAPSPLTIVNRPGGAPDTLVIGDELRIMEPTWENDTAYVYLDQFVIRGSNLGELRIVAEATQPLAVRDPAVQVSFGTPFPNPAPRAAMTLSFQLTRADEVSFELVDVAGRRMAQRASERFGPGSHTVQWRPGPQAPGVFFVRLSTKSGTVAVRRWVLLR